jgi:hypothetical protein
MSEKPPILCPMSYNMAMDDRTVEVMKCFQSECAWWNAECGKCSVCVIADSLRKLVRK